MNARFPSRRGWLWLCLGLALRLALIYFPRTLDDDTAPYLELGQNLLHHGVYGIADNGVISPSLFRLPGYPIFLALLGRHLVLVELVQSVLDLLGCFLLACTVRSRLGDRAAEWTLALGSFCLFTAAYAATALTESLSVFALALAIYGFARWIRPADASRPHGLRSLAIMAAGASLAMLLRPDGALVLAALALGMLASARRNKLLAFTLTAALALLPLSFWAVRNYRTFHVFQPLAPRHVDDPGERVNLGFYRWLRTWSAEFVTTGNVFWCVGTEPLMMDNLPARAFDSPAEKAETARLFARYNAQGYNVDSALDGRFAALAERRIQAHPVRFYVTMPAARIIDMLLRPRTETYALDAFWWHYADHPAETWAALGLGLLNLAYLAAAVVGAFRLPFREEASLAVMLGSYVLLRCLLLGTLENPEPRYSLELYPVVLLLAGTLAYRRVASRK